MAAMTLSVISNASKSLSASIIATSGSLIGDIDQVRSCFFLLLLVCTAIVAVGVVIEGIEHVLSTGKPYADSETGVFNAAPWMEWHKRLERFGWLLVIVGVVGEGIFEAATSSADNILQEFNNTLLTIATEQAGNASVSAKHARAEASEAEKSASKAQEKADAAEHSSKEALHNSIQASAAVSKVRGSMKEAEWELAREHEKRMQLEKSLAPRSIEIIRLSDKEGGASTYDALKPFAGMSVIIECIPDWEARRAAAALRDTMKQAGLIIESESALEKNMPDGVTIEVYRPESLAAENHEQANALYNAWVRSGRIIDEIVAFLKANDWEASSWYRMNGGVEKGERKLNPNEIRVRVGFKPAPYFQSEYFPELEDP